MKTRNINFKLELHKNTKVYYIFPVLLLEPKNPKIPIYDTFYY